MPLALHNALGHIGFGVILIGVFGAAAYVFTRNIPRSAWIGWAMQCAYWIGRERRDFENSGAVAPWEWWLGWNIFDWDQADLWSPIVVNVAFPLAVAYFVRHARMRG